MRGVEDRFVCFATDGDVAKSYRLGVLVVLTIEIIHIKDEAETGTGLDKNVGELVDMVAAGVGVALVHLVAQR